MSKELRISLRHANKAGLNAYKKGKKILADYLKIEEKNLVKKYIPNKKIGINYNLVYENNDEFIVAWVERVGKNQRASNKHLERILGELLFLKRIKPKCHTIIIVFNLENFFKYAKKFLWLFWDELIVVKNNGNIEICNNDNCNLHDEKIIVQKILQQELSEMRKYTRKEHYKFCTPTYIKNDIINKIQFKTLNENSDLVNAINISLKNAPKYIQMAIEKKDISIFNHSITWYHFNPLETLLANYLTKEKIIYNKSYISDINIPTFLNDININMKVNEDFLINNKLAIQVKMLTENSGKKNAKNEVRRMAARSFLTRWRIKNNVSIRSDIDNIAFLDGYWKGPQYDLSQNVRFLYLIGGYKKVFFSDEIRKLIDYIHNYFK